MKNFVYICLFLLTQHLSLGQVMHDFDVTDAHGQRHKLYDDYLNQGKVVVIKFFFTSCPPCIANAPLWQQKYVQHGSGTQDVQFFSVTTITSDLNSTVQGFESIYNQTMKGISHEGGAPQIVGPFKNGAYGTWWGTPSFAVIAPDRSLVYGFQFSQLDGAIAAAKTKTGVVPATVDIQVNTLGLTLPDNHFKLFIYPQAQPSNKIEIKKNNLGQYKFTYPSTTIPEMVDPVVKLESFAPAYTNLITASDLVVIQKHILGITPFDQPYKSVAADVNGDGKVTANDILHIKRVILGLSSDFPNNTPSYKSIPEKLNLSITPGSIIYPEITVIKVGNLN